MVEEQPQKPLIGLKSAAPVAHVGTKRADALTKMAIELSMLAQRQITSGQLLKYLIDNFAQAARSALEVEIRREKKGGTKT